MLAAVFETVSPAWLLYLDDAEPLNEAERALLERFRASDAHGQRTILRVARIVRDVG